MTTRKYNMIRKNTYLDGHTFTAIFDYLESVVNLDTYTAKQIADMMENQGNSILFDFFASDDNTDKDFIRHTQDIIKGKL